MKASPIPPTLLAAVESGKALLSGFWVFRFVDVMFSPARSPVLKISMCKAVSDALLYAESEPRAANSICHEFPSKAIVTVVSHASYFWQRFNPLPHATGVLSEHVESSDFGRTFTW